MYLGVGGVGVAGWRVVLILSYAQVGVEFPKMKFWFFEFTWLCKVVLRQKTWKAPNLSHAIYWYCLKLQLPTILLQWMDGDLTYKIKSWLTFFFTVSPATNIGHISTAYCSIRPDHTRYVQPAKATKPVLWNVWVLSVLSVYEKMLPTCPINR